VKAGGGTTHASAVRALYHGGVRVPDGARLVVIVVGDEAGEAGDQLARVFRECGYPVAAMALLVSVAGNAARGQSVRSSAGARPTRPPSSCAVPGSAASPRPRRCVRMTRRSGASTCP